MSDRLTPARMRTDPTGEAAPPQTAGQVAGGSTSPVAGPVAGPEQSASAPLPVVVGGLLVLLVVSVGLGTIKGSASVDLSVVLHVVGHHLFPWFVNGDYNLIDHQIVWELRLPEVLLAAVVGGGLAAVGATLQAVVRNPLADPFLLGVSSGSGLFAAASITLGSAALGGLSTSGAAFGGAMLSTLLVLALASGADGQFAPTRVVLSGVTLSFLFLGLTNYLIFSSSDPTAANSVLFWLLGSLSNASWSSLRLATIVVALGLVVLLSQGRALNALVVGEQTALSVGVNVRALRLRLLIVTSLMTGVLVSVAGGIAFVGLVFPHAVRLLIGSDHRRLLPVAALAGAAFLVLVDLLCRVLIRPEVLPIGVVTSVLGAPFFLLLLRRSRTGVTP